jgi:hypothetical protein
MDEATADPQVEPSGEVQPEPAEESPESKLLALKQVSFEERLAEVPHFEQTMHKNDEPHPPGMQRVRVDGGDSRTPLEDRVYQLVRAGHGEAARARRARERYASAHQHAVAEALAARPDEILAIPLRHAGTEAAAREVLQHALETGAVL